MNYFILILILFIFEGAQAQGNYMVLSLKGDVSAIVKGTQNKTVQARQMLPANAVIVLKEASEIYLVDDNGEVLWMNEPGNYPLRTYKDSLKYETGSFTKDYLKFVWHAVFHKKADLSKNAAIAAAWGGGVRSGCNIESNCPRFFSSKDSLILTWKPSGKSGYIFSLYDSLQQIIVSFITRETSLLLLTKEYKKGMYYWGVASAEKNCKDRRLFQFTLLTKDEEDKLTNVIISNVRKSSDENIYYAEVSDALLKAGLLDKAQLYIDKFWK